MTEHEHCPPKKLFAVRQISPRSIHFCVNGHSLFLSPEQASMLIGEIEDVLAGPSPDIICEQIYPTESNT